MKNSSEYSFLLREAEKAMENSYCVYSGFAVGAALLCRDKSVYTGCNIENASFSPTVCAERTAFFKAVSDGKRDFVAIAVTGKNTRSDTPRKLTTPCGVCRQVMAEFCNDDFEIILSGIKDGKEEISSYTLPEILPLRFSGKQI